ncbi:MAG TPA: PhzF family phenazine biosynthesis protein [Vicinamibacteria bacterium]|jgi:PhzF family phenazine biosynthesis protein|nr:PhzF family phenazine biosynthesis protein [Vicinamibacteria bacterium]
MKLALYHLDTFTSRVFAGNPAAVVPLEHWLDTHTLQAIAAENNLSETAFLVGGGGQYEIRWLTPATEVDLCGHATLASAHVVMTSLEPGSTAVSFQSKSGPLMVTRDEDLLALDFPARPPQSLPAPEAVVMALGRKPREVWKARDVMAVFDGEEEVRALRPNQDQLAELEYFGVIATAPGQEVDFVSRFFAPRQGVPEDPVTGSAHCTLVPYWARRLGKPRLHALQVSPRGGELLCEDRGDRVKIAGRVVPYLEGTIEI